MHELIVLAADPTFTPIDYSSFGSGVVTTLGGLGAGLLLVVGGALGIKGLTWGVPKIVKFFTRLS